MKKIKKESEERIYYNLVKVPFKGKQKVIPSGIVKELKKMMVENYEQVRKELKKKGEKLGKIEIVVTNPTENNPLSMFGTVAWKAKIMAQKYGKK